MIEFIKENWEGVFIITTFTIYVSYIIYFVIKKEFFEKD